METSRYDDDFVRDLFDRMGRSYGLVNFIASFGFSSLWRWQCVAAAEVKAGETVCDLMAGSGECWGAVARRGGQLISIDFSPVMVELQHKRQAGFGAEVDVRCEDALACSLPDASVDCVVSAFGLKTLDADGVSRLARELRRILRPGGRFSLLEISAAREWWLGGVFRWYLRSVIPRVGKILLGDIECYRMLSAYTEAFGSCVAGLSAFREEGLETRLETHFFGCATSLVGRKSTDD